MAASTPGRQGPTRSTPWALLLGLAVVLAAGGGGWWLGSRQRSSPPSPMAKLEREMINLRQRQARGEATAIDQQRLLELLVALDRQQEAIEMLEPMADREPDRWALRLMLAELRRDRGDRSGAERELRMILSRRRDQIEALQLMTLLMLERGRGSQAETNVRQAFEAAARPPVKPQALALGLLLAELQQKRGQSALAVSTYRRLANDFPQDQRPLLGLALLRHQLGDRSGALAALNEGRQRLVAAGAGSDPRLERLAASWGLAPLRASVQAGAARPGAAKPGRTPSAPGTEATPSGAAQPIGTSPQPAAGLPVPQHQAPGASGRQASPGSPDP